MTRFLGIDLGTSAVKLVVVDEQETVRARAAVPLATAHPAPLAVEQDPADWWRAVEAGLSELAAEHAPEMAGVRAIGLSGQMHALCLLDAQDRPVRPAMLWNDGRAHREAAELRARGGPELARALGVPAMAGFTAPKLLGLARHEPAALARAAHLLLPKDLIRLHLTGERATDVSDAAGTWLLDQTTRTWSDRALDLVGLDPRLLPRLVEGTEPTGTLRPEIARRFGMAEDVVVAGGAGDTPAGGIGIGAVEEGRAFAALSTSAQLFVAAAAHRPAPERLVHALCHGVPGRWYQMAAMLNGASVLGFVAGLLGAGDLDALLGEAEAAYRGPSRLLVLPYLAGERTPHDDPWARGVVFGLSPDTTRAELVQAALEGVAVTFADAVDALAAAGTAVSSAALIGGGARSRFWGRIVAAVSGLELRRYRGAETGAAFGAARLARLSLGRDDPAAVLREPAIADLIASDPELRERYAPRVAAFRRLYRALRPEFQAAASA